MENLQRITEFRKKFDYWKKFDVALLAPYQFYETDGERFGFYESISDKLINLKRRVMLPHKELKRNLSRQQFLAQGYNFLEDETDAPDKLAQLKTKINKILDRSQCDFKDDHEWTKEQFYEILREIIIPSAELILVDAEEPSRIQRIPGLMFAASQLNTAYDKHRIYFYREEAELDLMAKGFGFPKENSEVLTYHSDDEGLEKIIEAVKTAYKMV